MTWVFPLPNKTISITSDSMSFKNIDISTCVEIPINPHCGSFAIPRKHHTHEGIDLYANCGDVVIAVEDGIIVNIGQFTGSGVNSPWWCDTWFVMVEGISGVVCYGEIIPNTFSIGDKVIAGSIIGAVETVLMENKGRPMSMLHLELYKHGVREPVSVDQHIDGVLINITDTTLVDPTEYLIEGMKNDKNFME